MSLFLNIRLEKRKLQYIAYATCLLVTVCDGFHFGWASPYLPILLGENSPIPMKQSESSWVALTFLIGGPFGAIATGIFSDIIGRKAVLLLSCTSLFISWILIAFAKTLPELLIARLLGGFSDGLMFAVIPIYCGEICDSEIRGFLGSCVPIAYLIGVLFVNVAGTYLSIQTSAMLYAAITVIFFVAYAWIPESPNFFLIKGKKEKARNIMIAFKGLQKADYHLELVTDALKQENLSSTRFFSLFNKINRKSLLLVMGLRISQQFSGVIAFTLYAQTFFREAGESISPLISVVIFYILQILFSFTSSMFVDRIGRKPLLIISTIGSGISLLAEGVFFLARDVLEFDTVKINWLPTVVLIMFIISFSVGLQTVPSFFGAEIFPTSVKAYAASISSGYYYIFGFIASKYFQFTKDNYGLHIPFFTYAFCCGLGLIVIVYFIPETKNKTLEEIQMELKNKK